MSTERTPGEASSPTGPGVVTERVAAAAPGGGGSEDGGAAVEEGAGGGAAAQGAPASGSGPAVGTAGHVPAAAPEDAAPRAVDEAARLFCRIARQSGLLSPVQVARVLTAAASGAPAGRLCVQLGLLTPEQVAMVERAGGLGAQAPRPAPETPEARALRHAARLFGRLVVARGLASDAQVEACLAEQRELTRAGDLTRLGELLVRRGHLQPAQVDALLREQERIRDEQADSDARAALPAGPAAAASLEVWAPAAAAPAPTPGAAAPPEPPAGEDLSWGHAGPPPAGAAVASPVAPPAGSSGGAAAGPPRRAAGAGRPAAFDALVRLKQALARNDARAAIEVAQALRGDPEFERLAEVHVRKAYARLAQAAVRVDGGVVVACPACGAPSVATEPAKRGAPVSGTCPRCERPFTTTLERPAPPPAS